ncbi:MAG: efflux RND transporter periplasmic adaptor subunit [Hyphomicrobiaceae bacterium]|nr:efflux RND transporter periplasmic adaptor subunit [Hyphomicrobiaceae bacterium]
MKERLLPLGLSLAAVLVVASWMLPSLLPGQEPAAPARLARTPLASHQPSSTPSPGALAHGSRPSGAVSFSAFDMRLGEVDPTPVGSVSPARQQPRPRADLTARVVVKAEQTVAISAEINARVTAMPFREGDRFAAGATLVEFDCQRTRAELAAALAAHNLHRNAFESARQLQKLGSAGLYNVRQAQFEMEKAAADVDSLKAKQAMCVIKAPFAGIIAEKLAATHEVVSPNQPLLRIVDTAAPELQLIVPSSWLNWLAPGQGFTVDIDENRRSYPARVHNVSGAVDPVSQTVRVLARFEGAPADVTPGMSGAARFVPVGGVR